MADRNLTIHTLLNWTVERLQLTIYKRLMNRLSSS